MRTMWKVISEKRGKLGQYDSEKEAKDLAVFYSQDKEFYGECYVIEDIIFTR